MSDEPRCTLCGGTRAEHKSRLHAFTEVEGEMKTQAQVTQEQQKNRPQSMVMVAQPPPQDVTGRLIKLLSDKGVITPDEALSVLLGGK